LRESTCHRPKKVLLISGSCAGGMAKHLKHLTAIGNNGCFEVEVAGGLVPDAGYRGSELLHFHGYRAALVIKWWKSLDAFAGTPVAVTIHGFPRLENLRPLFRRLFTFLVRRSLSRADVVITVSDALRQYLERSAVPLGRYRVIGNGVDPALYTSSSRARWRTVLGARPGDVVIGSVCRLAAEKGIHVLLEAVAGLRDEPILSIAGDGPLQRRLQEHACRRGLLRTRFLGTVQDVPGFLSGLDIFVLPSLSEGQSIAVLEAMAACLPVVVSAVGGLPELVEGCGMTFPRGDADELTRVLAALIHSPELREELGSRARARVMERYTLSAMLRGYERVYAGMLCAGEVCTRFGSDDL